VHCCAGCDLHRKEFSAHSGGDDEDDDDEKARLPAAKRSRKEEASVERDSSSRENDDGNVIADNNVNSANGRKNGRSLKRAATEGVQYDEKANRAHLPLTKYTTTEVHPSYHASSSCTGSTYLLVIRISCTSFYAQESLCKSEKVALEETVTSSDSKLRRERRLKQFSLVNDSEEVVSLQHAGREGHASTYLEGVPPRPRLCQSRQISRLALACDQVMVDAGAIYPNSGKLTKESGRRLKKKFGPVTGWKASYSGTDAAIVVSTALADYTLTTPASEFRAQYNDAWEQVSMCFSILSAMRAKGSGSTSFEAVLAAVTRSKVVKGYVSVRDAVLLNGSFILSQVSAMQSVLGSSNDLEKSIFIKELKAEVRGD
jgi:hypothetical protein